MLEMQPDTRPRQAPGGNEALPPVTIVIIGRNEAENLPACIQSVRAMNYPQDRLEILYVDTDSTDGSPDVARALGVRVYEEHSDFPSPGRARNRGWREARHSIVHFIDGDMTIAPDYLRRAVTRLGAHKVGCVFGLLEERYRDQSWLSRLMHYRWAVKSPGYIDAPGAGGTFLKSVLAEVGGYNPNILQGEETELGFRVRQRNYKILLIDEVMGVHDYAIHTLGDWLRRAYRGTGYSFGRILQLPPTPGLVEAQRGARRNLIQGALALAAVSLCLITRAWRVLILVPLGLPVYVALKYWQPAERRWLRIAYFMLDYVAKPVIWAGMVGFWLSQRWPAKQRASRRVSLPQVASHDGQKHAPQPSPTLTHE